MKTTLGILLTFFCCFFFSACSEEESTNVLEGSWRLMEVSASSTDIINQREDISTFTLSWESISQSLVLTISGSSMTANGSYTVEGNGNFDGDEVEIQKTYQSGVIDGSIIVLSDQIFLDNTIFEIELNERELDSRIDPVELRFEVEGDELTLMREQFISVGTGSGITRTQMVSSTSRWIRE